MAITKCNGIVWDNVVKIDNIPKASIVRMNNGEAPAAGATEWLSVGDDRRMGYITNDNLLAGNDWESYDSFAGGSSPHPGSNIDYISVAYGKDGNGNGLWIATPADDSCEIAYNTNASSSGVPWTGVNALSGGGNLTGRRFIVQWGNDYWMAAGKMGGRDLFRSPDGANWEHIDVSSESGIIDSGIYALASDGIGTWWFAQQNRIYQSTNDGQSFSLLHTLVDSSNQDPGDIRVLEFTNDTLFAGVYGGECFSAAVSDLTDWSTETSITGHATAVFQQDVRVAAAGGRIVAVGGQHKTILTIDGKNITVVENGQDFSSDSHGTMSGIATDGSTWCACTFTGDMFYSTDGGLNFTASTQNLGSKDMLAVAANVYLPL